MTHLFHASILTAIRPPRSRRLLKHARFSRVIDRRNWWANFVFRGGQRDPSGRQALRPLAAARRIRNSRTVPGAFFSRQIPTHETFSIEGRAVHSAGNQTMKSASRGPYGSRTLSVQVQPIAATPIRYVTSAPDRAVPGPKVGKSTGKGAGVFRGSKLKQAAWLGPGALAASVISLK